MAFLKQRKGIWSAVFSMPGDRKKWVKIGKCSKTEAKRVLSKLEADIISGNFGILEAKPIALDDFAKIFLERVQAHKSVKSFKRDQFSIKRLCAYFGNRRLAAIQAGDIEIYTSKRSQEVKSRTVNIELLCLSAMFKKAMEWGYLARMPWSKIPLLKVRDAKEMRFLSVEEVNRLKDACTAWSYPCVMLALHTGMRLEEMLCLEWSQVDFDRRIIRLYNKPGFSLKNLQAREIPIDDDLLEMLDHYSRFYPCHEKMRNEPDAYQVRQDCQKRWVLCHPDGSRLLAVKRGFAQTCKRAGIEGTTPHSLRHTFASHLIMAGVPLKAVQSMLGHKSIEVTMDIYGHLSPEYISASINRLPYRSASRSKVILFPASERA